MAGHGPAPTPTSLLKLRGSWRANLNPDEPKADICIPPCPKHLRGLAKDEWERITPILLKRGCISDSDLALLEIYCYYKAKMADVIRHPKKYKVSEITSISTSLKNVAAEFGLSPSSRTRIKVKTDEVKEEDPFERLRREKQG